ncbi:caspase family protein [Microcoleus sp. LEGE 07076]|uniref:nSTAND1 domain-containing NTPase n=1 Tax=Microcoleus sp. LEGE 07076 TaxID=915322 RepID=UPI0018807520|nr:caspase family protein [Microcoleus sp. LEGE 07076]MBE9186440.1 caspase family protein [Microcoleus sp. LEGE 07076]
MARYALVIGIAQYHNSNLKPLPKAATDAEVVAQVLEEYGKYTVTRLPERWNAETQRFEVAQQKSVSADEVCEALQTLLLKQGTKSEVLIYFAGHGMTFFDNLGEQKGALATSDCQVEKVGRQVVSYKYGIDLSSLNRLIEKSNLSSLVMLLDCCHSGYFIESQLVQQTLRAFSTQKDYYLITACRSFETVKALAGETHAIFTGALLKGLASENASRNGQVSGDRLFDYISNELKGTQWGQEAIRMGWGRCITLVTYPPLETSATEITFDRENPYLGLSAFEAEQEKYFCGREEAVRTLITHLTNSRFLSVLGYSGSGKSSLIKAGLLPQLSRDRIPGSSQWPVESFTPGKQPLGKLVDILARHRDQNQLFVIFIDQFEEVFTLCEDEAERESFIRLIVKEMNDTERKSRMIIALRGDFLIRCANYPEVLNLINHIPTTTYIVKSLGIEELPEAIEKPAELHGVKFERGLVSQIAQDVAGQPGALPLLQYALKELWRVCIEKPEFPEPLLTKKGYEDIGGVQGALENRANAIYESLIEGDRLFVRKLFIELVQLGEGTEVTRRRVDWGRVKDIADSTEQLDRVIGLLAGAQQRLIIVDENIVEVAHEALLCRWKLVSGWIEEDLENIRISRRLETACREWKESYGKSDDDLLTGARLAEVEEWERRVVPKLTGDQREFLEKSVGRRDRELQQQINRLEKEIQLTDEKFKAQKQRTKWAIASGVLLTFTLGLGLLTNVLASQKKQREALAVGTLIGKAEQLLDSHNQLEAMVASLEALKQIKAIGIEDHNDLVRIQTLVSKVRERNRLQGHRLSVSSVSFSPNAKDNLIASSGPDKTVRLWKTDGTQGKILKDHTDKVWTVSFSPDGQYIASGSADKTIKIWRKEGTLFTTLKGHQGAISHLSFSPDGQTIASASNDRTIRLWQWKNTSNTPKIFSGHKDVVYSVKFSPNGQLLVSGSGDKTIKLWKVDGTLLSTLTQHEGAVNFVTFGSDSKTLASISDDNTLRFWKSQRDPLVVKKDRDDFVSKIITKDDNKMLAVTFSPNGELIAYANAEGKIGLWKVDGTSLPPLEGHIGQVNEVSFSPDGQTIITGGRDKTVRIWNLNDTNYSPTEINTNQMIINVCGRLKQYLNSNKSAHKKYAGICYK